MEESQHVASEHIADILHSRYTGAVRLDGPMGDVEGRIHDGHFVLFRRVLKERERLLILRYKDTSTLHNKIKKD